MTLLDQTEGIDQLAAISMANTADIRPMSDSARARYVLVVETLHRSASLRENQSVGLAFSILRRQSTGGPCTPDEFLQPGNQQLAAGIALFGPRTLLVLTTGAGVDAFTLDRDVGNFVLTHPQLRMPVDAHEFAIDASDAPHWPAPIKRYVDECVQGAEGPRGHDFMMRWSASAVVEVFRTLINGGVFLVPDSGQRDRQSGLPLLHNAAPLAMITEQAGGAASTGTQRILDVMPTALDSRTPLICGSADEVARIERYYDEHALGYDSEPSYPLFHNRTLFVQQ